MQHLACCNAAHGIDQHGMGRTVALDLDRGHLNQGQQRSVRVGLAEQTDFILQPLDLFQERRLATISQYGVCLLL